MVADNLISCPGPELLDRFRNGQLPDAEMERLADHLAECPACAAELARHGANDALLTGLRRWLKQPPLPEESACAAVSGRFLQVLADDSEATSDPPDEDAAPPPVLGPYEILGPLSGGGMGDLYKARHTRLKRLVVLKTLTPARAHSAKAIARFRREMEAGGAVPDHPNIVRSTDANEDRGVHFLVLEYIDGVDLARLSAARGPLAVADACELARQAALGLAHLHAHGLVHRDVKPSNLMLAADGSVKVLDLGLALLPHGADSDPALTGTWTVMETADYMAPEQIFDAHRAGPAADVYSLGCTLFKLLTGRAPFEDAGERAAKLRAHTMQSPPRLRDLRPDAPPELDGLLARLLAKQPDQRPGARELAEALAAPAAAGTVLGLLEGRSPPTPPTGHDSTHPRPEATVTAGPPPRRPWRRRAGGALLGGLAATLLLAGVVTFLRWNAPRGTGGGKVDDAQAPVLAGRWIHPFQRGEFKKLRFIDPFNDSSLLAERDRDQLTVVYNTTTVAMVECGAVPRETDFKIEVGMRQGRWETDCGLFFGYEEFGHAGGKTLCHYQCVYMIVHRSPNGPTEYELAREYVERRADGTLIRTPGNQRMKVQPAPNRPHVLTLRHTAARGLTEVTWDGRPTPELTSDEANNAIPKMPYAGRFGLYQTQGSVTYQSLRYILARQ